MKKYLAEVIGTFVLTFFGCGVAVVTGCSVDNMGAYVATALAFGLTVVAMAYCVGNISGGHFNPAVSIAMLTTKKLSVNDFIGYVISQCIGAVIAAALLSALVGRDTGLGANGIAEAGIGYSLIVEIVLTFAFVLCIMGVTSKKELSSVAGLVIGLALTLVHLLGIGMGTGTSVNPARSLGPALFAGGSALTGVWVFIVAPLIGGVLAALCYGYLEKE